MIEIDVKMLLKNKEHHSNLISSIRTILDREGVDDSGKVINIITAMDLLARENPIPLFKPEEIAEREK